MVNRGSESRVSINGTNYPLSLHGTYASVFVYQSQINYSIFWLILIGLRLVIFSSLFHFLETLYLLGLNVEGVLQDAYFVIINLMNERCARHQAFAAVQFISSLFWNLSRRQVAN